MSFSAAVNSETREEVAIKKIGNAFDNRIDAKRTLREIKVLRHMDHENVISLSLLLCLMFLTAIHFLFCFYFTFYSVIEILLRMGGRMNVLIRFFF